MAASHAVLKPVGIVVVERGLITECTTSKWQQFFVPGGPGLNQGPGHTWLAGHVTVHLGQLTRVRCSLVKNLIETARRKALLSKIDTRFWFLKIQTMY